MIHTVGIEILDTGELDNEVTCSQCLRSMYPILVCVTYGRSAELQKWHQCIVCSAAKELA